ncbi:methyltransferase domain-containing protein [Actinophytocola gossypii]|uniref:Methyltransferase domain-containing protein n=1 Tax=Actinophytocola gossypii TaxID=2812003 RepID=A0ABT2J3G9_9PSEU|nr:methyltransferase domain-containing protein [Actinophytocola gossypii]MCT2581859.1 methyltransferase domain-containing protein [Actinophytocola gossypii]
MTELEAVRTTWEQLGSTNPYWAVLTENDFHEGEARAEFFATGRTEVREMLRLLEDRGHRPGGHAVDFGCGVGRLSFALAEHVDEVTGVDVARSMLDEAVTNNPFGDRVRFVHNESHDLPFPDDSVDLVVSSITLQHIPPSLSIRYLMEMVRITRPGGHLLFQQPSHIPAPVPIPAEQCRATLAVVRAPGTLVADECGYVRVSVRNDGTETWPAGQLLNVGNHWYRDDIAVRWDDGRASVPCPLAPGESGEVTLQVTAPSAGGDYQLGVDVVQEHVAWWSDRGTRIVRHPVTVEASTAPPPPRPEAPGAAEQVAPAPKVSGMQMHGVRTELVCGLLRQLGCTVLDALPDRRAGDNWASYFYVVEVGEYRLEVDP